MRLVEGSCSTPDLSPDGRFVAFRGTINQRRLSIASVENGAMVIPPFDVPGAISNARPRWTPDGRRFVYSASDESGALGLYIQDFVPGVDTRARRRPLLEFVHEETPETFGFSPDGTRLIYSIYSQLNSLMLAEDLSGVRLVGRRAP